MLEIEASRHMIGKMGFAISAVLWCGGQSTPTNPSKLSLELKVKPARFSLDNYVGFEIAVVNDGEDAVYIHRDLCVSWQWIIVGPDEGKHSFRGPSPDTVDEEPSEDDLNILEPGSAAFVVPGGAVPALALADTPGMYTMRLSCRSPFVQNEHEGVRVWNEKDGPIAASFEFEIFE